MRQWDVAGDGRPWKVELDVRDLGGHLDLTCRAGAGTLSKRVKEATQGVSAVGALLFASFLRHFSPSGQLDVRAWVAGTPGACSQVFCHPNLVQPRSGMEKHTIVTSRPHHQHHNHHNHHKRFTQTG